MAEQTYRDEMFCDNCGKDTEQIVHDDGHERDSSGCWQVCTVCGYRRTGMSGEWSEFATQEEIKKWYSKIK